MAARPESDLPASLASSIRELGLAATLASFGSRLTCPLESEEDLDAALGELVALELFVLGDAPSKAAERDLFEAKLRRSVGIAAGDNAQALVDRFEQLETTELLELSGRTEKRSAEALEATIAVLAAGSTVSVAGREISVDDAELEDMRGTAQGLRRQGRQIERMARSMASRPALPPRELRPQTRARTSQTPRRRASTGTSQSTSDPPDEPPLPEPEPGHGLAVLHRRTA
jgi:hypothetical protein